MQIQDLNGRTAFITGGANGIGLGITTVFARAGLRVIIADRSQQHLEQAMCSLSSEASSLYPIQVDVTDRARLARAASEAEQDFGPVHVLVNNAGVQNRSSLSEMTYEEWDRLMAVNLGGVFNGIHEFVPRMKRHGEGGHIITTASIMGLFTASGGGYGAYCASKFAVVAMMESLRAELSEFGIGVSVLCPGLVKTNLEENLKDLTVGSDPVEIGHRTLQGMLSNEMYILTHPEFNEVVNARNDAINASAPADIQPSAERVAIARSLHQNSIYVRRRDEGARRAQA